MNAGPGMPRPAFACFETLTGSRPGGNPEPGTREPNPERTGTRNPTWNPEPGPGTAPVPMSTRTRLRTTIVLVLLLSACALDGRRPPAAQWSTRAALAVVHLYQRAASPLMPAVGVRCRFTPTCSRYADAVFAHTVSRAGRG